MDSYLQHEMKIMVIMLQITVHHLYQFKHMLRFQIDAFRFLVIIVIL